MQYNIVVFYKSTDDKSIFKSTAYPKALKKINKDESAYFLHCITKVVRPCKAY